MTAVRLSPRQEAALLALLDLGVQAEGTALATQMCNNGRQTSIAAAHQAANALDIKGLAVKLRVTGRPVRYEITDAGRALAERVRGTA
ncbi:MAG TPA: hypothetical protein VIL16_20885 [Trebonia sp.]